MEGGKEKSSDPVNRRARARLRKSYTLYALSNWRYLNTIGKSMLPRLPFKLGRSARHAGRHHAALVSIYSLNLFSFIRFFYPKHLGFFSADASCLPLFLVLLFGQ